MDPGLIWILGGLLLLGAELFLPGAYLMWIGIAAVGTGLYAMAASTSFLDQSVVFLVLLAAGILGALRLRGDRLPRPRVNTPDAGLVGRSGVVLGADAVGLRVRLGDSEWAARLPRDVASAEPGARVRVEGVDGTMLVVRPE
jgi:membrane protein implicated in regulation of membrane protease activity